jgi:hypothetical protein
MKSAPRYFRAGPTCGPGDSRRGRPGPARSGEQRTSPKPMKLLRDRDCKHNKGPPLLTTLGCLAADGKRRPVQSNVQEERV